MNRMLIPKYNGSETTNEDIVYSFFRLIMNNKGYSFRVKRTGYIEVDSIIPSANSGIRGKGSCDAYFFSGEKAEDLMGLLELESTGNLHLGIVQIRKYASGFLSKSLTEEQKKFVKKIHNKELVLIVYDGQNVYLSLYSLVTGNEKVLINNEPIDDASHSNSKIILEQFPKKTAINREQDEKGLINNIARIIRGSEKIQKNKAFVMTVLSSVYGQTKDIEIDSAIKKLKSSQITYEQILYSMWTELKEIIGDEDNKISKLYVECAAQLYELSQDRGMDLYGFIYEELATKDVKKEQGEYYTPRHTIRPLIGAVYNNYLKWSKDELEYKNIVDPFCGSGGFLYEFVHFIRKKFDLSDDEINQVTKNSIYGFDKNGVLAAQLNMYLVGDGKTNLSKVNTSINWKKHFLYKTKKDSKYDIMALSSRQEIMREISKNVEDINNFLKVYVDREFSIELDDIMECYGENEICDEDIIQKVILREKTGVSSADELGNVDLLLTNVPYGKVTDATNQIMQNGIKVYGNSLEANALRECIDLLRPGKMQGIDKVSDGGVAIIIVPDSILENPTNKPIRDYMISRCDVLGIVSLPEYTFSPYAMEKTYAIVLQKLAPEEFNYNRKIDKSTFMYISMCDGRANSKNRYRTNKITSSPVILNDGTTKEVNEFLHNDFEPCFESYDNTLEYFSKLERAWNAKTYLKDPNWDQVRRLETWNGRNWDCVPGKKWGFFRLEKYERVNKKKITCKTLKEKFLEYFSTLDGKELEDKLCDIDLVKEELQNEYILSATEQAKLDEIDYIEIEDGEIIFSKLENIVDVDMNVDSERYLGEKREPVMIENIMEILQSGSISKEQLVDFFSRDISSDIYEPVRIMDLFYVYQGSQFSKEDAYQNPGDIPVFTAATDGPAYFVQKNIPGKTMLKGKTLIWSRKGAKAGTIQIFDNNTEFYISDVSGTIMPKDNTIKYDFTFLKFYIEGQLRKERQSISNNAQLNKSKVENLLIYIPDNQKEIGDVIRKLK